MEPLLLLRRPSPGCTHRTGTRRRSIRTWRGRYSYPRSRSGHVEPYKEESYMAVTYRFYARTPWIFLSTRLEVRKDIAAKALRNGEIVLDRKLVDEFAWGNRTGAWVR